MPHWLLALLVACYMHVPVSDQGKQVLAGWAYSTCGVTQVALVSVQPSLNTYLRGNLAVWPSRDHPSWKPATSRLHDSSRIYEPGVPRRGLCLISISRKGTTYWASA